MIYKLHIEQHVWYEEVYSCERVKGERERRFSLSPEAQGHTKWEGEAELYIW